MTRATRPSRDTILRWLDADPKRSSKDAEREFNVPEGTIRSWKKRARDEGRAPNLAVLPAPAASTAAATLDLEALSKLSVRDLVRLGILQRLARLALPIDTSVESLNDSAKIVASLTDRYSVFEGLEPVVELDPTSEAGLTALRAAIKAFPPETQAALREALAS